MYGYFGTTIIQAGLLVAGILTFGQLTGFWIETALVLISGALVISVWRRNQMYRWLEKRPGQEMTQVPGLWLDMTQRIQKRESEIAAERDSVHQLLANLHQSLTPPSISPSSSAITSLGAASGPVSLSEKGREGDDVSITACMCVCVCVCV